MVKDQIEKAELAASLAAAETSPSTATVTPSASVDDEFAGLEDDDTTSTKSSKMAEPTYAPPLYTMGDLKIVSSLYDSVTEWLTEKLAEQDKLPATADPVILGKDLAAKAKALNDAGMDLIMRSMKQPPKSKRSSTKSKSKLKTKKTSGTKTDASEKAQKTIDFGDEGQPMFRAGEDGELPSEEEILEAIRTHNGGIDGERPHDEL
jgi:hypoxia up-regulated 1